MTFAAIVAVVAACAVAASSSARPHPVAVITHASGDLSRSRTRVTGRRSSRPRGLRPGRSVSGTVQLSNNGTLAGDLGLRAARPAGPARRERRPPLWRRPARRHRTSPAATSFPSSLDSSAPLQSSGSATSRRARPHLPIQGLAARQRAPADPHRRRQRLRRLGDDVRYSLDRHGIRTGRRRRRRRRPRWRRRHRRADIDVPGRLKKLQKKGIARRDGQLRPRLHRPGLRPAAKSKRARKSVKTRIKSATHRRPNKVARIRIKLSKKNKRPAQDGAPQEEEGRETVASGRRRRDGGQTNPTRRRSSSSDRRRTLAGASRCLRDRLSSSRSLNAPSIRAATLPERSITNSHGSVCRRNATI